MGLTVQAQFTTQLSLMTPHYYPGEVYFKDGHHEEFAEVELPRVGRNKLGVRKAAEDKKKTDISAEDIIGIKIWHKDFPDKVHVLYYVHARKAYMQSDSQWGTPIAGSAWGVLYQCEQNYQINKKTGNLDVVKFVGGTGPDTPTLYYLVRDEWKQAELLLMNGAFPQKKKAAELFAENESIATAIRKGKLGGSDIEYILNEMAGGQQAAAPAIEVPAAQTDTVSNGVIGDDE